MKQPLIRIISLLFKKASWVCGLTLLLGAGLGASNSVQAATYPLNIVFSSSGPPVGLASPALGTVTLTDFGDKVRFEVVNSAGQGTRLDSLYFNFQTHPNPLISLNPAQLVFYKVDSNGVDVTGNTAIYDTVLAATISTQEVGLKADGDGYFDGKFQYATNNFLGHGQTLEFELGIPNENLDPIHFNFLSIDPQGNSPGPFVLASHILAFPGDGSAWVAPVPIPPAALLFGSGLLAVVAWLRRSQSSRKTA